MLLPPQSETELMQRAHALAGCTLAQVAKRLDLMVPIDQLHDKGWVGQLLERALVTTAGTLPVPDFMELGIELKTLPLGRDGQPRETTFVSSIPLLDVSSMTWESSIVRTKLACVLWIPLEADKSIPLADRRIGMPILWRPSVEQEQALRQDWEELTDMIALGQLESITAHHGRYLQIRPKGANAKSLCWAIGPDGSRIQTLPRGFYLRTSFTRAVLSA